MPLYKVRTNLTWKFVEHQLREVLVSVTSRKMGSEDGSGDSLWKVGVWR